MGLGFEASAGTDALYQLLAKRRREALERRQYGDKLRQQQFENDLRSRQFDETVALRRENAFDRQQRDRDLAQTREENALTRQVNLLPRNTVVTPDQYGKFDRHGFGPLFRKSPALPAMGPEFQGPSPDATVAEMQQGRPAGYLFAGTARQDEFDDRMEAQRSIAQARQEATDARQAALDAYRWANYGLRDRALDHRLNPPDNPALPRGVQDYLVQLRGKYGNDLQAAEAEFGRALADVRAAHPHLDSAKAILTLRSMFGSAPGASSALSLGGSVLGGNGSIPTNAPRITTGGGRGSAQTAGGALRTPALKPGMTVTLKDGRRATISVVHPDGTFGVR